MAEYYVDEFQTYLEGLCEKHVDVQHNVGGIRTFARLMSDEEVNELTNHAGKNIVVVAAFYGRAHGHPDDQQLRQFVQLRFASFAERSTTVGINEALKKSFRIMWDFITRMKHDIKTDDGCGEMNGLEFENLSWDEIPGQPWLENHFGWDLTIPFKSYQPQYDAAQWTS